MNKIEKLIKKATVKDRLIKLIEERSYLKAAEYLKEVSGQQVNIVEIIVWVEENKNLFLGKSAKSLMDKSIDWKGIDSKSVLEILLGETLTIFTEIEQDRDIRKLFLIDRLAGKINAIALNLSNLEKKQERKEIGLAFASELALTINTMASEDPKASSQAREWVKALVMAAMKKLEG